MIAMIGFKEYDTSDCRILADHDHWDHGNYIGTSYLLLSPNGDLLVETNSYGCKGSLNDNLVLFAESHWCIDDFDIYGGEESKCVELGLIK